MIQINSPHVLQVKSACIRLIMGVRSHLWVIAALLMAGSLLPATVSAQSPPPATSSLIVKFVAGLSVSDQTAVVARNGGLETSTVPALRLHVIEVGTEQLAQALASYQADPQVVRAEVNKTRKSDAAPSDPLYGSQWSLPKIAWDQVFGVGTATGTALVAVLDTGIDATHPDLNGNVLPGTSILDGSNGVTDPSGHGTRVAGIIAARTNSAPDAGIAGVGYTGVRLIAGTAGATTATTATWTYTTSALNAGTHPVSASYVHTGSFQDSSDSLTSGQVVNKANATVVVTPYTVTYDGLPHTATGTATGVLGESLSGLDLTGTTHTNAGTYATDPWNFTDVTGNYFNASATVSNQIGKRPASVTPNSASKFLGNSDPTLTGTLTNFVASDGVTATYSRTPGETAAGSPYTISATLVDPAGALANYDITYSTASFYILAVTITGPVGPIAKGNPATATVSFPNYGTEAGPSCSFNWDDTTTTTVLASAVLVAGNWTCSAPRIYAAAGVYEVKVKVTVTDDYTGITMVSWQYVVIYDANAGFVTGGGWINSPPRAYLANPALVGKANFGFVSKYQKGQSIPTGDTEFQFKAGDFNFHSTSYEWLVIAGSKAQYKGAGTVNGAGVYGFLLTANDGKVNGGGGVDQFRIKVWLKSTGAIVYDNNVGASDDIDSAYPQALGGGSITVHK